jgi:hypothetical protein
MSDKGTFAWFRELSDADYQALLTHFTDKSQKIYHDGLFGYERQRTELLQKISRSIKAFGRRPASIHLQKLIWKRLFQDLSPALQLMSGTILTRISKSNDHSGYSDSNARAVFHSAYRMWKLAERINVYTAKQSAKNVDILSDLRLSSTPALLPKNTKTGFESVDNIIKQILDMNGYASSFNVSTEEEHFLTQTTAEYIPQILEAAMKIQNGSEGMKAEFVKNFTEQLNLVLKKTKEISENAQRQMLGTVKSQTMFLTESLEKKEIES